MTTSQRLRCCREFKAVVLQSTAQECIKYVPHMQHDSARVEPILTSCCGIVQELRYPSNRLGLLIVYTLFVKTKLSSHYVRIAVISFICTMTLRCIHSFTLHKLTTLL